MKKLIGFIQKIQKRRCIHINLSDWYNICIVIEQVNLLIVSLGGDLVL